MSITQGTTSTDLSTLLWVLSGSSYAHLYVQGGFQHCVLVIRHDFHILRESIFDKLRVLKPVAYPGILFGGVQQIQLRTEDRENGDLGAAAP